jgi:hypothetical protein
MPARPRKRTVVSLWLCVSVAACARAPIELGFWMEPVSYQSPRIGAPISSREFAIIDTIARAEIRNAFAPYGIGESSNHDARYRVHVVPTLQDERLKRSGTNAGESRAIAGFGGSGAVNFEYVANGAMVFAPASATRPAVIEALGRGIGRVAIHEFLHQLMPKAAIHDSKDTRSYEGNSPALAEGYFGDLHWDLAAPWLRQRVGSR